MTRVNAITMSKQLKCFYLVYLRQQPARGYFEFVCPCEAWRPTENFRRSRYDQTSVCQQPSLMFETCECKHTPTRGGTMHASLQTANKREAASLVVVQSLNLPTRKRGFCVCAARVCYGNGFFHNAKALFVQLRELDCSRP